jgi:RNA polymerase sigma factor (TIGR02999 family)
LRFILVDYSRAARAAKRGGRHAKVPLSSPEVPQSFAVFSADDLLALDEALSRLEEQDRRAAQIVELRFFAGLKEKETAEALQISVATVKRDWEFARAWLSSQLACSAAKAATASPSPSA